MGEWKQSGYSIEEESGRHIGNALDTGMAKKIALEHNWCLRRLRYKLLKIISWAMAIAIVMVGCGLGTCASKWYRLTEPLIIIKLDDVTNRAGED